jgi:hypothetical protein
MRQTKTKRFRLADGNERQAGGPGVAAWRLAIALGLFAWLTANLAPAQVAEQPVWPREGSDLWHWVIPRTDLSAEQVEAVFDKAVAEESVFLDSKFPASLFFAKKFRLTKGKAGKRKEYGERPEKADNIRIEAEWRNGYLNQYRGRSYCTIAMDAVRGIDLHYLANAAALFPKAPAGRNWNVNILAASRFSFFFALEDTARAFINAAASALRQRGLGITFSRFGLMWENVTPAQAADMGRDARAGGVLVTMVARAGPAEQAGIQPLDVILEVGGSKVKNFSHFSLLLEGIAPRTRAALLLLRRRKDPNLYPEQNEWQPLTVEMEAR